MLLVLLHLSLFFAPLFAEDVSATDDDHQNMIMSKEYRSWLKRNGVTFSDVSVGHVKKNSGGSNQKGVFALEDLEEGSIFLRVLLQGAVLNIEHALTDEIFMNFFPPEQPDLLDDPTIMSAYVAFCKASKHGIWSEYIDSLPLEFTTPLYFPDLTELQASEVADATRERLETISTQYDLLPDQLKLIVSPPLFQWAYSVLLSRSFGLQIKDHMGEWQGAACLVPGADLLNTGANPNADCGTNEESTHFECLLTTNVTKGQEIVAPYGAHINEQKLLLDYGFILGANFTARVILDPKWEPGANNKDKPLPGSIVRATAKDFARVKEIAQRGLQKDVEELTVCQFVIDRLQRHLESYPTTIAADEAILQLPPPSIDAACRGCMPTAVKLRLGEKKVFQALLNDARIWLQELETKKDFVTSAKIISETTSSEQIHEKNM